MNNAYKDSYLEGRVMSADPVELIHILYEHAIDSLHEARGHLATGDIAARSRSLSKVFGVLGELEASLDHKTGGEISRDLARLYEYMSVRLTEGNFHQKDAPFAEVETLLRTLGGAWSQIATAPIASAPITSAPPARVETFATQMAGHFSHDPAPSYTAHAWSA